MHFKHEITSTSKSSSDTASTALMLSDESGFIMAKPPEAKQCKRKSVLQFFHSVYFVVQTDGQGFDIRPVRQLLNDRARRNVK